MSDDGPWFEAGVRVDYFRTAPGSRELNLEQAVLGTYEVLGCKRVEVDGRRWLDVRLRRIAPAWASPVDR